MAVTNTDVGTGFEQAGFQKLARLTLPSGRVVSLLTQSASITSQGNPKFTQYCLSPPLGPKQKTLHSKGVVEISWAISSELTSETAAVLELLDPRNRGKKLIRVHLQQGSRAFFADDVPWEKIAFSCEAENPVTLSLSGKSILPFSTTSPLAFSLVQHPIPGWATGSGGVLSWEVSHSTALAAKWWNSESVYPRYYRVGESEFEVSVTTLGAQTSPSTLKLGVGGFEILEGVITQQALTFGDRNSPVTYKSTMTSAQTGSGTSLFPEILGPVNPAGYLFPVAQYDQDFFPRALNAFVGTVNLLPDDSTPLDAWPLGF